MPTPPPFLSLAERVQYLYDREYFDRNTLTGDHIERLGQINFHHFLGYARNYRMLFGRGLVDETAKRPGSVFAIIDRDHQVAELLYRGLRQAEWRLRRLAVEHYCSCFPSTQKFLDAGSYVETVPGSGRSLVRTIIDQALRYGEPYVSEHIDDVAKSEHLRRYKRYEPEAHDDCLRLVRDLPLWSIIDGLTLGSLSRFITQCDSRGDADASVSKLVADGLGVPRRIFPTQIESLVVTRNLIAHHNRIWMRPTTSSPKKPKLFSKALRDTDSKAMKVAFYNVAMFQRPDAQRDFVSELESTIQADPTYAYGVTTVFHRSSADRSSDA